MLMSSGTGSGSHCNLMHQQMHCWKQFILMHIFDEILFLYILVHIIIPILQCGTFPYKQNQLP